MKNIFGWLIAGVGAYYLYEKYYASPDAPSTGTVVQPGTTTTQNGQNTQTSISASNPPVTTFNPNPLVPVSASAAGVVSQLQGYIITNGLTNQLHNLDEWNWYLTEATGHTGPAIEDIGISVRNTVMNSSSYSNLIGAWLSGGGRLNGLGKIVAAQTYGVPTNQLYANRAGIPDRPTIVPTGFEWASKKVH